MECLSHKKEILGKKSQVLETNTTDRKEPHDVMEEIVGVKKVDENIYLAQVVQTHLDQCRPQPLQRILLSSYSSHIISTMGNFVSP